MPRANRHCIPGYVWHITHRCHKRELLLTFARDRQRWMVWLLEAKKRFGLTVLNYMVTCNHIHLLVCDDKEPDTVPESVQLIADRTGQESNRRKGRAGAFWEDRYYATAIEQGEHLVRCMVYIDINMVRAGVVKELGLRRFCGYTEIERPKQRSQSIDMEKLAELLEVRGPSQVRTVCRDRVMEVLLSHRSVRESKWSESIAVESEGVVAETKARLSVRALGRQIHGDEGSFELREPATVYACDFAPENVGLRPESAYLFDVTDRFLKC